MFTVFLLNHSVKKGLTLLNNYLLSQQKMNLVFAQTKKNFYLNNLHQQKQIESFYKKGNIKMNFENYQSKQPITFLNWDFFYSFQMNSS